MASQQLCWTCRKACGGGGCPWADKLKPVPGWKAEKKQIRECGKVSVTYHIISCPLYENGRSLPPIKEELY